MISFDAFSPDPHFPIYMQIILYIKRGIASGTISNNDELPSRRYLSALLGVNPNTVQRAFKMLEDEDLILSQTGAKSKVNVTEEKISAVKRELLQNDIGNIIRSVKQTGLTMDEALELIKNNWDEVEI